MLIQIVVNKHVEESFIVFEFGAEEAQSDDEHGLPLGLVERASPCLEEKPYHKVEKSLSLLQQDCAFESFQSQFLTAHDVLVL